MFETVTVDEAIKRGRRMVNLPVLVIMIGGICFVVFLYSNHYIPGVLCAVGSLLAFVSAWLYWSFMITKWRLWAFENVRNVHELQRKAIEAQLIWPEGNFLGKTEIRSAAQRQKLNDLSDKFVVKDVFQEDHSLPDETAIFYSRGKLVLNMVLAVFIIGVAVFMYISKSYVVAAIFAGLSLYLLFSEITKAKDKSPQLIISSKGIETKKNGFVAWADISNEQVISRRSGKTTITYLEFDDNYGSTVQTKIDELDVTKKALDDMLHTYRIRSEKGQVTHH